MLDKTSYNKKGKPHGCWEKFRSDGKLWYRINFINGYQIGYVEMYYINGKLMYEEYHAK